MIFLKTYKSWSSQYLLFEELRSLNNPISELLDEDKLGIIMMGVPGAGKSTFINNSINKYRHFKSFSTEDISRTLNKGRLGIDSSNHHSGAGSLNLRSLFTYMKTGNDFIYDTTGLQLENIKKITTEALSLNYKLIFITVVVDMGSAIRNVDYRRSIGLHGADRDYMEDVYDNQLTNLGKLENDFPDIKSYVVDNTRSNYRYYERKNGKLIRLYR